MMAEETAVVEKGAHRQSADTTSAYGARPDTTPRCGLPSGLLRFSNVSCRDGAEA